MKNIELKISFDDFRKITPFLRKMGAKQGDKLNQVDIYYYYKGGRFKIRVINNHIYELIFYQRPDKKEAKISNYQVLNINPTKFKKVKSGYADKLGEKVTVRKQRILWIYKHTRIHLDNVDKLGRFLELETMVDNINLKQAKKEYNEIVKSLNLSRYKKHNKSYSDLLLARVGSSVR